MHIAVLGAGGVGGYFGARLAQGGEDVVFVARGAHLEAMRADGLQIESPKGDFLLSPVKASDDTSGIGTVDMVLVAVKAWQLAEAIESIRPLLGPETAVVPLLNGVEAPGVIADALGAGHALGGLCGIIAYIDGPGRIKHVGIEPFVRLGEMDNSVSTRVAHLREAFERSPGVEVDVPADIQAAVWRKFLFIAPVSGVGAVSRATFTAMRETPATRELIERAMREALEVGRAHGVDLDDEFLAAALAALDAAPPDGTTSMQRDIESGRRSELEAQTGAIVRLGAQYGVATPVNDVLYRCLLPLERRARGEIEF
ncbi:MAG: 2-dehydropantoate 2-reductase [Gammaproteobacteria bacterium]|nr:2-dehydropantoate 2-reductase [Gammaproteobacteria bacterium]